MAKAKTEKMAELAKVEVTYLNKVIKALNDVGLEEAYKPYHDVTMSSLNERLEHAITIAAGKPLYTYNIIIAEDNGDEVLNDEKTIVSTTAKEIADYINNNMQAWADDNCEILTEDDIVTSEGIDSYFNKMRSMPYIFEFGSENICSIMITIHRSRIN